MRPVVARCLRAATMRLVVVDYSTTFCPAPKHRTASTWVVSGYPPSPSLGLAACRYYTPNHSSPPASSSAE